MSGIPEGAVVVDSHQKCSFCDVKDTWDEFVPSDKKEQVAPRIFRSEHRQCIAIRKAIEDVRSELTSVSAGYTREIEERTGRLSRVFDQLVRELETLKVNVMALTLSVRSLEVRKESEIVTRLRSAFNVLLGRGSSR